MANPNVPPSGQTVDKFAKQANITAEAFSLTIGQSIILDLDSYVNNKVMQINTFSGSLTVKISLDGLNFFTGPSISSTGITVFPIPCRYIQLTSTGTCAGLVFGSLQ